MGALILLSQPPMRNPVSKEQLELVEGWRRGVAQFLELASEATGPEREVRSHRQYLYCPIDRHASFFP
jgi:hypothetical protein